MPKCWEHRWVKITWDGEVLGRTCSVCGTPDRNPPGWIFMRRLEAQ